MGNVQKKSQQQLPVWHLYSRYQEMRLWRVALLSMNVAPTAKARTFVGQDAGAVEKFRYTKSVIRNALSERDSRGKVLWLKDHANNGNSVAEKMISLKSFVAFADFSELDIPKEMRAFWGAAPEDSPKQKAAETNKDRSLAKILAAIIYKLAANDKSSTFKDVVTSLELDLEKAGLKIDRETLCDRVEAAKSDYLNQFDELTKRLLRPKNQKRS